MREAHDCIDLTHSSCSEEVDTCATDIAKSLNISYNSTIWVPLVYSLARRLSHARVNSSAHQEITCVQLRSSVCLVQNGEHIVRSTTNIGHVVVVGLRNVWQVLPTSPHRLRPLLHRLFSGYHVGRHHLTSDLVHEVTERERSTVAHRWRV